MPRKPPPPGGDVAGGSSFLPVRLRALGLILADVGLMPSGLGFGFPAGQKKRG